MGAQAADNELLSRTASESSIDLDVLGRKMSDPEVFQIVNKKSRFLPYLADDFRDTLFSTNKATAAAATRPLMQRVTRKDGTPLIHQTSTGEDGKLEEKDVMVPDMEEEGTKVEVVKEAATTPESTLLHQNTRQEETSLSSSQQETTTTTTTKVPVTRPPLPPRTHTGKEKANNVDIGFTTVSVSEVSSPSPFESIISPPVLTEVPPTPDDEQVSPMTHSINSVLHSAGPSNAHSRTSNHHFGPTSVPTAGAAAAAATYNTMTASTTTVPDAPPPPKPPELLEPFEGQRQQSILMASPPASLTPSQPGPAHTELHVETHHHPLTKASTFPCITPTSPPSLPCSPSDHHHPPAHPTQSLPCSPSQPRDSSSSSTFPTNTSQNQEEEKACLLVDDNPINLHILASAMRKTHRPYATARNGLEAVEIYKESPGRYKWVLMDISMPVMDGLEATRRIRQFEREFPMTRSRSVGRNLMKKGGRGSSRAAAPNKGKPGEASQRTRAGSLDTEISGGVGVAPVEVGVVAEAGDGKRVIQRKVERPSFSKSRPQAQGIGLDRRPAVAVPNSNSKSLGGGGGGENGGNNADEVAARDSEEVEKDVQDVQVNGDGDGDGMDEEGGETENENENSTEVEGEPVKGLEPATVVALTGVTSGTIQKDALASGVDLFLTKPVRMKDLGAILGSG